MLWAKTRRKGSTAKTLGLIELERHRVISLPRYALPLLLYHKRSSNPTYYSSIQVGVAWLPPLLGFLLYNLLFQEVLKDTIRCVYIHPPSRLREGFEAGGMAG
jgi:hypothetical protein